MSLATRLRALKVLSGPGKDCLDNPAKLKSILCPVIARTPAEQDRFYELFDRYLTELMAPLPEPPPTPIVPWWEKVPKAIWYIIGALSLMVLSYTFYRLSQPKPLPPKAFFQHDEKVHIGDTLHIFNLSERMDTADYHFRWELYNGEKKESEVAEVTEKGTYHWHFVAEEEETNTQKRIRLTVQEKMELDSIHTYESSFNIHCVKPPEVLRIEGPNQAPIGELFTMEAFMANEGNYTYEWFFGADNVKHGTKVFYQFNKEGSYEIRLNVIRQGVNGICRTLVNHPIKIGTEKAYLTEKVLVKDPGDVVATTETPWTLTLVWMGILGLLGGMFYNLWKWWKRKAPLREEEMISDEDLEEQFKATDKAPYFIPFRSKNGQIRTERDLFRFADVLRLRQEGLQKYIDVPNTIHETIHKGGFPNLKYATRTEPSEYLFLIDEESTHSHQSKLFEYLAELLKEKDIYAVVYWYKRSFHRFWNKEHPDGFSLSLLHRLYPNHRIFVMGNGHELQDPFPEGEPALKKAEVADFKRWKERFLLSPLPPESWTFREGLLYDLFTVFPATLEGLNESSTYLERVLDQEDIRPSFKKWREVFLTPPHEPDVNYRKWRRANDHRKYLTEHRELYQWVCALAVYQKPTWELTIAIGKALQPFGVEVTFDNLCLLARIPWLQTGDLHPRLRKELLNELDPKAEALARAAVKKELEVVQDLVGNGHAARELKTNLAIQNFATAPDQYDHQKTIRYLLNNGLLNKKQIADLNQNLERYEGKDGQLERVARATDKNKIHAFLDSQDATRVPLPKPFVTKHLIRAATYLALFVFFFVILLPAFLTNYEGTKKLHDLVFGERIGIDNSDPNNLKDYLFVKEIPEFNLAKDYNNKAVELAENINEGQGNLHPETWFLEKVRIETEVFDFFEEALNIDPNYDLAKKNMVAFFYNAGQERYQAVLNESVESSFLEYVILYFKRAEEMSEKYINKINGIAMTLDIWHALGLTHYYLNQKDSAQIMLAQITKENPNYFADLNQRPNLETLLGAEKLLEQVEYKGKVIDAKTKKGIGGIDIKGEGFVTRSNSRGEYVINLPKNYDQPTVSIRFKSKDYKRVVLKVDRIEGTYLEPVALERINAETSSYEEKLWTSTKLKNTISNYETYLKKFPDGKYADEAAKAIEKLVKPQRERESRFGSNKNTVDWTFSKKQISADEYDLIFTGKIAQNWYTYGNFERPHDDLPFPTTLNFDNEEDFELLGKPKVNGDQTGKAARDKDDSAFWGAPISTYTNQIVFTQRVKVTDLSKPIEGYVNYQAEKYRANTNIETMPATNVEFSFTFPSRPPIIEEIPEEEIEIDQPSIEQRTPDYTGVDAFNRPPTSLYFDNNKPIGIGEGTITPYSQAFDALLANRDLFYKNIGSSRSATIEIDNFYKNDVIGNYEAFKTSLSLIRDKLLLGSNIEITLRGNASILSNQKIGKNLTSRRIASIKLEILNYKSGVLREFQYNGQLKIIEEPLANLTGTGAVSELQDQKTPYRLDVAKKRRVEVVIREMASLNRK